MGGTFQRRLAVAVAVSLVASVAMVAGQANGKPVSAATTIGADCAGGDCAGGRLPVKPVEGSAAKTRYREALREQDLSVKSTIDGLDIDIVSVAEGTECATLAALKNRSLYCHG